jgi:protocatechuate 3,4-dioxygenase beta subunit
MQEDDLHRGRLLTRREALALTGASILTALAPRAWAQAASVPQCIARPEQTEGPFFVDDRLNRSDIRTDPATGVAKPGAPLRVTFRVMRIGERCAPIPGAVVDLWQCDAAGAYSGVRDFSGSTVGQKFLRGYQVTDANGAASFTTIYPG